MALWVTYYSQVNFGGLYLFYFICQISANLFCKGPDSILGFVGHIVSLLQPQTKGKHVSVTLFQ